MSASVSEVLREGGWSPRLPVAVRLDGEPMQIEAGLRLLPGKRLTVSGHWRGEPVVAKLFLPRADRQQAAERAGYRALRDAGLNTPELLWAGQSDEGLPAVVYRCLSGAVPLSRQLAGGERERALRDCLALLARMHAAGLYQSDIHLDNFLWAEDVLYIVDNASIERGRVPLSETAARENLAAFLAQFTWREQRELWPCLSAYHDNADSEALRELVRQIWWRRVRKYLRKIYRDCTEVAVDKDAWHFAAWKRQLGVEWNQAFLADPDAVMARGEMLKDGNTATVVAAQLDDLPVVIKRFNIKSRAHAVSRAWRPSRAWNAWRAAHLLQMVGIATPAPLMLLERRRGPLRAEAYLVTEHVPGREMLEVYGEREPRQWEMEEVASIFALMREARLCHGDLKASNFLVSDTRVDLIDLDVFHAARSPREFEGCRRRDTERFLRNWRDKPALEARMISLVRKAEAG